MPDTTETAPTINERRLLDQARAAIAADWTCVAIPGDADGSIESWALLATLGIFTLQLWEPGPQAPADMPAARLSLTVGAGAAQFGGIMLHFDSYNSIDAALTAAAMKLREIAASVLAPLHVYVKGCPMPFTPPPFAPIPLLDASVYAALGDVTPSAHASGDARLEISFRAGSILIAITTPDRTLAVLEFNPQAFHEAAATVATALDRVGGHVISASDRRFWLVDPVASGPIFEGARLTALWPPRDGVAEPPLSLITHVCSEDGGLAVVVHLTPHAARQLVRDSAHFLADLAETAGQVQAAASLSLADLTVPNLQVGAPRASRDQTSR